jgi:hypothetical protein
MQKRLDMLLHPSLLSTIARPKCIRDADWACDFILKSRSQSLDSDVICTVAFSAMVQRMMSNNADGPETLVILKPLLSCDFDACSASADEEFKSSFAQQVNTAATISIASPNSSPSSGSMVTKSSPKLKTPQSAAAGSRGSELRSLQPSERHPTEGDAVSPTQTYDVEADGHSLLKATSALKAIRRLQRHLEADQDGVVLGQLWSECPGTRVFGAFTLLFCDN